MADANEVDASMEDDYDEEADSDFDVGNASDDIASLSSEDEADNRLRRSRGRPQLPVKTKGKPQTERLELDSGDEATIQEQKREKQKQQQKGDGEQDESSDIEEEGWRARTRAMRDKEQSGKKRSRLVSGIGSTIDVDQMWAAMNRSGGLDELLNPASVSAAQDGVGPAEEQKENTEPSQARFGEGLPSGEIDKNHSTDGGFDEMITIDETYEFAGEIHTRKKAVPTSSAEAKLWLSQRSSHNTDSRFPGNEPVRRPLRKVSRFDPNFNNLESFRKNWERSVKDGKASKLHKLNTVEKSKMDWAAHVDQEGLRDELNEHAKAKEGYLGRMQFLGQVEQRREEAARSLRMKD